MTVASKTTEKASLTAKRAVRRAGSFAIAAVAVVENGIIDDRMGRLYWS